MDSNHADKSQVKEDTVNQLAAGLVAMYEPKMQRTSASIKELLRNQSVLIDTIEQENIKFMEAPKLDSVVEDVKIYHNRLVTIKKQMVFLREKSNNLKQRAQKLQKQKEKELEAKRLQKQIAKEKEEQLIARPAVRKS